MKTDFWNWKTLSFGKHLSLKPWWWRWWSFYVRDRKVRKIWKVDTWKIKP